MLFRKMLRDMWRNKTQFISIFLMTVIGIFIYSGVSSEYTGLQDTANDFYEETNLADAWVYSSGFTKEAADAVRAVEGVTGVERRLTISSVGNFDNNPTIKLHFAENNLISTGKLMEGEAFTIEKDGIWLDTEFAKVKKLKVGDSITVTFLGLTLEKEIKGLIMSPEYVYSEGENDIIPVPGTYGYAYLSYLALPKEIPMVYTDLLVTTEKPVDLKLENAIDQALDGKYSVFLARKNLRSYMQFSEEMKEHKAIGKIFPLLFLAVAMLTIVTTMARLVNNQRTQIGILKALGFKRRKILFHYISYGLWISLAGTVIGAVVGPLTLPYLFYGPMMTTYMLPEWRSAIPISLLYMAVLSVAGCTLATYFACRNVLKDTPSETLRPKAPKDIKHSFFDRLKLWEHLSFDIQWNLRDIFRCKGRSIMAIVGILGCSALLICAFGMRDTFDYIIKWNYEVLNRYETRLELKSDITSEQTDKLIEKYDGEAIQEGAVELKANGKKRSGELLVTDQASLIRFVDKDSNNLELPVNQISVSYKIAKLLGLKLGDTVSWHVFGDEKWNTSTIGAIYRTPFTQGITVSKGYFEQYGYHFTPTTIITKQEVSKDVKDDAALGISKVQSKSMLVDGIKTVTEAMNVLVFVLMIAAVILAVVVIYNLGVLAFTERQRELSTLKVIGFKTGKLRSLLLKQNIWLTLVGIVPGIPIGLWILNYIFNFVGEVFDFMIIIYFSSYVYCIAGTLLISVLVNRLFSKRVRKIDMVSSLKGVE
ncbi:MAG TPA: FtsX-like permease family protein [Mobilitalea sp.]|nr:FtsX-like permease family protein [Mobilitalea sp.]